MTTVSAVISAYNEEANIGVCLSSISWADEIIVVDNGSLDKTASVAKKHGARVYHKPNNLMLNVNKNFGISKATKEWVLYLDADERIPEDLAREIRDRISDFGDIAGYWIKRKNILFGKWIQHGLWWPDKQLRLFRSKKGLYPLKHVHEYIEVAGKTEDLSHPYEHENYSSVSQYLRKMNDIYTENEAAHKLSQGYMPVWHDAVRFPLSDFLKTYFAQSGYKDGLHGLVLSMLQAFYSFVVFAKCWERHHFAEADLSIQDIGAEAKRVSREWSYWWLSTRILQASGLAALILRLRRKFAAFH